MFAILGSAISFAAQEVALSAADQLSLDQAISSAAETVRSGSRVSWQGSVDIGGTITPGPAYSNATGAVCDECTDPCRRVSYTIVSPQALAEYRGTRCRESDDTNPGASTWVKIQPDRQTRYLPVVVASNAPPSSERATVAKSPAIERTAAAPSAAARVSGADTDNVLPRPNRVASSEAMISDMQTQLTSLLYYHGPVDGKLGLDTRQALTEFLHDERSSYRTAPLPDVLYLLKAALARVVHATCPTMAGIQAQSNIACGKIAH